MKIHVRRRHIERGDRNNWYQCPIALALKESFGQPPRVHYERAFVADTVFILPKTATRFIARFDAGKPVKPFAFVLK